MTAAVLEEILQELKWDFTQEEIQDILKYGVVGSLNSISRALAKSDQIDYDWKAEYIHTEHFLKSIPSVLQTKVNANQSLTIPNVSHVSYHPSKVQIDPETEKMHIVSKMKAMLKQRGVTIWEALLSCNVNIVDRSKIKRDDWLKMLKVMN